MELSEAVSLLDSPRYKTLKNVRICGVMGMATLTDDMDKVRQEFRHLRHIFNTLKKDYFAGSDHFSHISMGMSGDYRIAIEEGSTMVRIGTALFN